MLKRNPWLKHWRMLLKIWKKYVWVTAHLNFNFWYCNPISKAKQGHKLKFSCPKWAFCHKSSLLFSFLSCPTQLLERGESQHVKYFLGTGNYFFLWVNEGNYKNWGEENDLWTCSNCLDFFPDFLLLQNLEFWAFEGPFQAKKLKDMKDDGTCILAKNEEKTLCLFLRKETIRYLSECQVWSLLSVKSQVPQQR